MSNHKTSVLPSPTVQQLLKISESHGLDLGTETLEVYKDLIDGAISSSYSWLDEQPDVPLEVKYPRTPGYRPSPEENTHNAWYFKTNIKGADNGKLLGKKVAIKDCIFVAGVPMIIGSQLMEGFIPDEDATIVTKILDEGGVIAGKSNCENMCYSGNSATCIAGPVLNPVDKTRSAGGSSGGSTALVKLGEVDMAIGGDQGGSIRIPSSWCGVVGLKPTHGLVPYTGILSVEPTLDHTGPIANTVKDVALLLEVIAGYDAGRDYRQPRDLVVPKYSEMLTGNISGKKIGILKEGVDICEDDVIKTISEAIKCFTTCDAILEEVSIPQHKDAHHIWTPQAIEGCYKTMIEHSCVVTSVKGHQNVAAADKMYTGYKSKANALPHAIKLMIMQANYIMDNCGLKYVAKSHNLLPKIVQAYDQALEKYDVLVMPTLPYKAPKLLQKDFALKEYFSQCFGMIGNTCPFDSTGHPALTVNAGYIEGLPVGLQIVGKHWDEATVLNVAYAFEQKLQA